MAVIHPGLFLIMRRFPAHKNTFRYLYESNSTFLAVCHDYQVCERALAYWRQSGEERASERYEEYEELQQSLEQEIRDFIGRRHTVSQSGLNEHE
jgi:hypothetical protein